MHESVLDYVKEMIAGPVSLTGRPAVGPCRVLEVGAYNVNGSVRDLFDGCYYRGVDIRSGPGVDHVIVPHCLPWPDGYFDITVSTETLEHDLYPWRTVREMARVTAPEGYVILTARGFDGKGCFPYHDHGGDHYRWSLEAFGALATDAGLEVIDVRPDPGSIGVFLTARA